MSRTFVYARVSRTELTTSNQLEEVKAAGFTVDAKRIVEETISGSTEAFKRPLFAKLVDRLEAGDVLIVTKLDRLGRSALDVRSTVEKLAGMGVRGVRYRCLCTAHRALAIEPQHAYRLCAGCAGAGAL